MYKGICRFDARSATHCGRRQL